MKVILFIGIMAMSFSGMAQDQKLTIIKVAGVEMHKATRTGVNFSKCLEKFEIGKIKKNKKDPENLLDPKYSSAECKIKLLETSFINEEEEEPLIEKALNSNLHILVDRMDTEVLATKCLINKIKITDKKAKLTFKLNKSDETTKDGLSYDEFVLCTSELTAIIQKQTGGKLNALFLVDTMGTLFDQLEL